MHKFNSIETESYIPCCAVDLSKIIILLNQAHSQLAIGQLWACAWFPKIVFRKVCVFVCLYVYLFVFPHPREQTFYLKLESSLYTINKG